MMDAVVIGAGPIGLIAARALAHRGDRVRLFDPSVEKPKMSLALAESTLQLLARLGVDDVAGQPIGEIHVSEKGVPGSALMTAESLGYPRFGRVACSHDLEAAVRKDLSVAIETERVASVRARGVETPPKVILENGDVLAPDVVLLADGGRSPLTESLGFVAQKRPFDRTALLGRVRASRPIPGRAYERFVGTGPLAMLPLSESIYGFVWSLEPLVAERLLAHPTELMAALSSAADPALGILEPVNEPVAIPLVERWIDQPYRPGVMIIGNGAQTIHPVAGQGLNLALRGLSRWLAALDESAVDEAMSVAFSEWKRDRDRTRLASSALERLFNIPAGWRRLGTAVGLSVFDQSPRLKRQLAEAGMGLFS